MAVRRMARTPRLQVALLLGAAIAGAMIVIAFVAAALSGGPVTRGRLATVGPSPWHTALFAGLEVGAPAILAALSLTWYRERAVRLQGADAAGSPTRGRTGFIAAPAVLGPVRRLRPHVPGFGKARRTAGVVLSAGAGSAPGSDSTGSARRTSRAGQPTLVDLVKTVDLVKAERPGSAS